MALLTQISVQITSTLMDMAPYLLFGFAVAGILSVLVSQEQVERHLGGHGLWPVIKASLLGVPLPLCSCGVIPVTASLRKHGASKGAAMSFLLSTPQTGVDSIAVTFSLLGPVFAVFRPVVAFISGIIGGIAVNLFDRQNGDTAKTPEKCNDECCAPSGGSRMKRAARYAFAVLPSDLAKPLIAGLLIAGMIEVLIPDNFFQQYLGRGIGAMIVMMLVGIPMYVCATASVPIALAMMLKGVSPGAALVFLMTGPATNAASIAMVWKLFGKQTAVIYLLVVAGTALLSGLALDYLFTVLSVTATSVRHEMLPDYVNIISAIALLAILAAGVIGGKTGAHDESHGLTLGIKGMTCSHCVDAVRHAAAGVAGVTSVSVSLEKGAAEIEGKGYETGAIVKAIKEAGYEAEVEERSQGSGVRSQ